jgi:hypothetical protein
MKRWLVPFLIVLLMASVFVSTASAGEEIPPGAVGGCPDSFHLHMTMDHDDQHHADHLHVGTGDLNGDGWICVKHVVTKGVEIHIHKDNNLPR